MARAALIGHAKPRTANAMRQVSKKLSDHAVANTWWQPSNLPPWLTKEFYIQEVQPKLTTIKVKEIGQALAISKPYAALIRAGRRLPHQRHWETLAKLAKTWPESGRQGQ